MLTELFLVFFVILIVLALMFAPGSAGQTVGSTAGSTRTALSFTEHMNVTPGILVPADHPKKNLSVGFAEMREERVFSKKTGRVKYDRVSFT